MRVALFTLAALALLPLAGCDEATGLDTDVELIVDDAVVARQRGEFVKAVDLLESALAREPQNAKVRVELATTLLERDGIDLLDLERIGRFLSGAAGTSNATARAATSTARAGCSFASDPDAVAFDPVDAYGFEDVKGKLETIAGADRTLRPVIPEELRSFSVCSSVTNGTLVYDRAVAIQKLRDQGLSEEQVKQALAVNALNQFLLAYDFIANDLSQQATWYRLADGSVRICVADENALRTETEGAIAQVGEAVLSLDARASLVGAGSVAAEVVQVALDAYDDLRTAVADYCSTAS